MKTVKHCKAIIFDLDDTLVKTYSIKWAQHKKTAKDFYNIDLQDEDIKKHWGKPFDIMIGHLYQNSDTVDNMCLANMSSEKDFLKKPHKNSLKVVNELLNRGLEIGVLSSTF